ncbi:MAG: biotin--[acetyl-CoA-carboxylase] ligase [Erythrobacter sp.]
MIRIIDETGSTNADLAKAIRAGESLAEGEWLVARRQTAGKGRQGREWFDGTGNFMGSTLVRIGSGDPPPGSLGYVAALAIWDACSHLSGASGRLHVKWPNDVLLDGGKLSGVLLELVGTAVVAGIGINLTQAPQLPDRKTSALVDTGAAPPLEDFARLLGERFHRRLSDWREYGLAPSLEAFLARSIHSSGSAVSVHDTDGSRVEGTFAGLDQTDGALRLRLADGSERVIRAGDVS